MTAATKLPARVPFRYFSQARARQATYRRFGHEDRGSGQAYGFRDKVTARVRNVPVVVWVGVGGSGVYYVYHLERTETGRLRFMDVTLHDERRMGDQAAEEVIKQYARSILPENHSTTKYVRKVANRILAASGLDTDTHGGNALKDVSDAWGSSDKMRGIQWKVRVIADDSTKNAFVLPNGSIFVFVRKRYALQLAKAHHPLQDRHSSNMW